jgi:hypothetical protein
LKYHVQFVGELVEVSVQAIELPMVTVVGVQVKEATGGMMEVDTFIHDVKFELPNVFDTTSVIDQFPIPNAATGEARLLNKICVPFPPVMLLFV